MKYNKIFIYTIILLTKNIFCYDTKNLNDFLYGSSQSYYVSKDFSAKIFCETAQRHFKSKHFVGCKFLFCTFDNFTLSNGTFNNSRFFNANFIKMNLSTTLFHSCNMENSKLINCNLNGTKFILYQGLSTEQKHKIEKNGGMVIEKIIKVKSSEEYWAKAIQYQAKGTYDRVMIYSTSPSLLTRIKNKINRMYNSSMQKTRTKIHNIYSY